MVNNLNNIKCTIIGDSFVGKTSIISKYFKPDINKNTESTLGAIFWSLSKNIDDYNFKLDIWDTAGQERYHSLIPMYIRNTDVILVVFDLTNRESFNNLDKWYNYIIQSNHNNFIPKIIFIGNKVDRKLYRCVFRKDINSFFIKNNISLHDNTYFESSAITGENINYIFERIFMFSAEILKNKNAMKKNQENNTIHLEENNENKENNNFCYC